MKITIFPKSRLGKWSTGLNLVFLAVTVLLYIFAEKYNFVQSDAFITIFGGAALIMGVIAGGIGLVSVLKDKERSVFVFLAIVLALVVLGFILGDFIGLPDV